MLGDEAPLRLGNGRDRQAIALREHLHVREFLVFARRQGNDLVTPAPEYGFPGLKPGDRWCVCAATWRQAYEAGIAPPVVLAATHEETLAVVPLSALREHAVE